MGNQLASLPQSLGQLKALQTLDVSYNLLQQLPDEIGSLEGLVKIELSHNKLKQLPETMGKNGIVRGINDFSLPSFRSNILYLRDFFFNPTI